MAIRLCGFCILTQANPKNHAIGHMFYTGVVRNSAFLELHIFSSSAARTTRAYSARNRVLTRPES